MKSLTLHGLDDQLAAQIRLRASQQSISMNELAKRLLAQGLGIKVPAEPPHRESFAEFCGTWTEEEAADFDERTSDMRVVDPKDWA